LALLNIAPMKAIAYTSLSLKDYEFFCLAADLHIALFRLNSSLLEEHLKLTPYLEFDEFEVLEQQHIELLQLAHFLCTIHILPLQFFNL